MNQGKRNTRPLFLRFLFPLLSVSLGLLAALILAEGIFKTADILKARKEKRLLGKISRISDLPGVRYEMVPNITTVTPGTKTLVRINNLGFRGPDLVVDKPPDTYRIAVIGDSITFGRNLEERKIFPAILERNMNSSQRYPTTVEVVNAGLSGRDTWEEYAVLKHRVLPLDPDLVILQICLNDHVRLPFPGKGTTRGLFGEEPWYHYSSLLAVLDERIEGFRSLHLRVNKALGLDRRAAGRIVMDRYISRRLMLDVSPRWEEWSRVLLDFHNLASEHGAEVLFVMFPIIDHIKRAGHETLPLLTEFALENDIPLLDLREPFFRIDRNVLHDHTHPTALGHRVTAEEIEKLIAARFLPPGPKYP